MKKPPDTRPTMKKGACPRWPTDRIFKDMCKKCQFECKKAGG